MEELMELRGHLERREYDEALALITDMEEMSRDDKINKIGSYLEIILIHLIKRAVECRTTRSWDVSIKNAADAIEDVNRRRKRSAWYFAEHDLRDAIDWRYLRSLRRASLEAHEGRYDEAELAAKVDESAIKTEALRLVAPPALKM